jgi:hypothetical protein
LFSFHQLFLPSDIFSVLSVPIEWALIQQKVVSGCTFLQNYSIIFI